MAFPQVNVYLSFDEAGKHFNPWRTPCVGLLTRVCSSCLSRWCLMPHRYTGIIQINSN